VDPRVVGIAVEISPLAVSEGPLQLLRQFVSQLLCMDTSRGDVVLLAVCADPVHAVACCASRRLQWHI